MKLLSLPTTVLLASTGLLAPSSQATPPLPQALPSAVSAPAVLFPAPPSGHTRSSNRFNSSTTTTASPPWLAMDPKALSEMTPVAGLRIPGKDGAEAAFPLEHTDVQADIQGNVTRVAVTQRFTNPFDDPLEAVYVFPLPDEAAVDEMEIQIGDRTIKGEIKQREEAQEIYDQAVAQGRTAGLLEQERANIFTQSLANIRPGETIEVTIRYSHSLKFEGGNYEFVFPMVVGPRYIPGQPLAPGSNDTAEVPDASSITPPVLKPGTRSGHDISVTVNIDAGVPIQSVGSTSHQIRTDRSGNNTVQVQLEPEDSIPNKDLVLRYAVSGKDTQATILSQADDRGGHFAAYLLPAINYAADEITAKDVVFLMDTSGSQRGAPLAQSKALMRRFIAGLNPDDTFTIIDFANTTTQLSATPLANTAANRTRALRYIDALEARGGTELMNGINAVMAYPEARRNRLRSVVLLTDGYIGNDREIIAAVQQQLKPGNRLYSFGVGSSTNRFLLNRLAEVGRGTVQVVRHDQNPEPIVERFFNQINRPVLTDVQVNWQGAGAAPEIYPQALPDLFDQQPLVLYGRQQNAQSGDLEISGRLANGQRYRKTLPVDFDRSPKQQSPAIGQLWGRAKVKSLMNELYGDETTQGVEAVTTTALAYRLLSQYTAFVAVSEEVRVDADGNRQRVQVPVELPEGVSYEGIFGDQAEVAALRPAMSQQRLAMPVPSSAPQVKLGGRNSVAGSQATLSAPASSPAVIMDTGSTFSGEASSSGEAAATNRVITIEAEGLTEEAIATLEQYIRKAVPTTPAGELVFELRIHRGKVQLVALDKQASTIVDAKVIQRWRQALQVWREGSGGSGKALVTIGVQ